MPNAEEMTVYVGDYISVPHISVDKYGRVTDIYEVPCYVGGGGGTPPTADSSLMRFSYTPDGSHLLCTYDDRATAVATFELDERGHLMATYTQDPSPVVLERVGDKVVVTLLSQLTPTG